MSLPASFSRLSESKQAILQERLRAARAQATTGKTQTIPRHPRSGPLPLAYIQQQLWFLDRLAPGNPAYTVFEGVHLRGRPLDVMALERSFVQIIARHEVLRSSFPIHGAEPVQLVRPAGEFRIEVTDLSALSAEEREKEAQRLARIESQRPFDLEKDLLIRARLLRLGEDDHLLLVNMHHIASDGWSLGILYRELSEFYRAETEGRTPQLAEMPIQFGDYAAWQRTALSGSGIQKQLSYWKTRLAGAEEPLRLPADRPRPAKPTFQGRQEWFTIPTSTLEKAKALARAENATLFMVLAATFKALFFRYTSQKEIVVGTTVTGRSQWETEPLIGPFINTIPLRSSVSAQMSFRALLQQVRETTLDAYAHQDVPMELLVQQLQTKRHIAHLPLFQVVLILQNVPTHGFSVPGFVSQRTEVDNGTAKFDLLFSMTETPQGLEVMTEYSTDLFEAPTVQRINTHFQRILTSAVNEPDADVSRLPLLQDGEAPLRAWEQSIISEAQENAAVETQTTAVLQRIWAEVLRQPEPGLNDNFFDLGGHSILAIQIMARVNETFQLELGVGHLFEAPTIGGLAAIVERTLLEEIQGLSDAQAEQLTGNVGVTS